MELVKRCLAADAAAWEALLQSHTRKIYNLCYRFTGRPAESEDLTQEVFIKVFQTLRTFDAAQGSFGTWLSRVARNHLVDHYRRTKKDRITSSLDDELATFEEKPGPGVEPVAQLESRERRELLQRGLERLSRTCGKPWFCATCRTWTMTKSPKSWGCRSEPSNPESTAEGWN